MKPAASALLVIAFAPLASLCSIAAAQQSGSWTFAVSGDSRNCGDIVMPSIAQKVRDAHANFYWHLGDFRASSDVDQDMLAAHHGKVSVREYELGEWPDFIDHQLAAFSPTPVVLGVGNHELISKSRNELLVQFADWFDSPAIGAQRLADNPSDHALHTYFHWRERNVDFITLDNASSEMFDPAQVLWFEKILKQDEADPAIRTVTVGMHDALPDSLSAGHSMNESAQSTESGRRVYADLLAFRKRTGKEVQVLASHSHFVLADPYKTSCRKSEDVLAGWIVGSAGAVRYRLPIDHAASSFARTDVYGFLVGTVSPEGHITFAFQEITEADTPPATLERYGKDAVHECFIHNSNKYTPEGPTCPKP